MHIFILGSLNTDFVLSCTRYPEDGETVKGQDFFVNSGGKGANQAIACARLGGEVSMCGRIGKDPYGTELKKQSCLIRSECGMHKKHRRLHDRERSHHSVRSE